MQPKQQLLATVLCACGLLLLGSCREQPPYEEAVQPHTGGSQVIECGTLPDPTPGQRCDIAPSTTGSKFVLLRGTVLQNDRVLHGGEVLISDQGKIACADCDCHTGITGAQNATQITCADGVISPSIINTHDHITYNKLPPATHATNRYDHRHEWRLGVSGDPTRPKIPSSSSTKAESVQWNELRHVMAGTTASVSAGDAPGLLRNLDSTTTARQEGLGQAVVNSDTFPLGDSGGERLTNSCSYPNITTTQSVQSIDAYEPHISEGVNAEARNEFLCTSQPGAGQNLLLNNTALVHGITLNPADACLVAQRGASHIWSPRSNVALYGHTALTPMLDRQGVLIALGTDWTLSGSINMLRELSCADDLNRKYYDNHFSIEALWRMATLNASIVTATNDAIGQIVPGYFADIAIFLGQRVYAGAALPRWDHAAVVRAGVEDVLLVMRGGLPLYGEGNVMEGLGAGTANKCEALDVCGVDKRICAERETKKNLADLETAAGKPTYRLFACGAPADEPTCTPLRVGQFDGMSTPDDPDGDGLRGVDDNCPNMFNPIRPLDNGKQADADGDGVGDACDPCPLDKDTTVCPKLRATDCDGDGFEDGIDNCPGKYNPDQTDTDVDGQGDVCDTCPMYANPGFGPCLYSVKDLRTPGSTNRPSVGSKVRIDNLLILGLRAKASFGFHARDLQGSQDYAGIIVFLGGSAPPKATDGTPLKVGDVVSVTGRYTIFSQQDEVDQVSDVVITGSAPAVPIDVMTRDLVAGAATGERLESLLLRVRGVTQRRLVAMSGDDDFFATDEAGEMCTASAPPCTRVGDFLLDNNKADGIPAFTAGTALSEVTGIVSGFGNIYSLEPRDATDIK